MSWWVSLNDEQGEPLTVAPFEDGGTYQVGGSEEASLNITYNYSPHYYAHLDAEHGLRWLDGKRAKETVSRLEWAASFLGTDRDTSDYWKCLPGNAGAALAHLTAWAKQYPEGKWRVA